MKHALHELINRHSGLPGLAAWCARLPDGSVECHRAVDWFTADQLETTMELLAGASKEVESHGLDPLSSCWNFERGLIYFAKRPDEASLAILVENRPGISRGQFDRLIEEFRQLPALEAGSPPRDLTA